MALGKRTRALGKRTRALGKRTRALGKRTRALGKRTRALGKRTRRRTRKAGVKSAAATKDRVGTAARHRCTVPGCGRSYGEFKNLRKHQRSKHSGMINRGLSPRAIARRESKITHKMLMGPVRTEVVRQLVAEGWLPEDVRQAVEDSITDISSDPIDIELGPAPPAGSEGNRGRQRDRIVLLAGVLRAEAAERLQFMRKVGDRGAPGKLDGKTWHTNLWDEGEVFDPEFEEVLKSDQLYRRAFQPSPALVRATHASSSMGDSAVDTLTGWSHRKQERGVPTLGELRKVKLHRSVERLPALSPLQVRKQKEWDERIARALVAAQNQSPR